MTLITEIPADYEVQPVALADAASPVTCGECGLTWDDSVVTSMTPAPSARCPFEAFHSELLDFDARYKLASERHGCAWYLLGYEKEWTEEKWTDSGEVGEDGEPVYLYDEPEEIENRERVRAVMVGDDSVHTFGLDELEKIAEADYCHVCGQIGCTHDGYERGDD